VETALEGMKSQDGLLRINPDAGVIYISDTPRKVSAMVRFLDSLSETLSRQVFIEARIMEVVHNDGIITLHFVPTLKRLEQQVEIEVPTSGTTTQTISKPVTAQVNGGTTDEL
jgi:hypothetical protein